MNCSISVTRAELTLMVWKTTSSPFSSVRTNSKHGPTLIVSLVTRAWKICGDAAPHCFTKVIGWWIRLPVAIPLPASRGCATL